MFHKSDLSLDAVIKFFAAGFVISTPTAFVVEAIIINIVLFVTYCVYGFLGMIYGESFRSFSTNHYGVLLILSEVGSSFLMAAAAEEFCKYYTFRTVE